MAKAGAKITVIGVLACLGFGSSLRLERYLEGASAAAAAAQERYAIAFAWFFEFEEPPRDMETIAEMFCPAVLSMTLGVEQAKAGMAAHSVPAAPIDKLMFTDLKTLPTEILEFMTSRGVRVKGVEDDVHSKARKQFAGTDIANVLKLNAVVHPEWGYAAVQLADWDEFILSPADLLTPAAQGRATTQRGTFTPTNGGLLVVRPSAQLGGNLARALEHGFSWRDGWGGNYSQEDLLLAKPYVDNHCAIGVTGPEHVCCTAVPRSMWCFAAAQADQGLLFHLMIDGGRQSSCLADGDGCPRALVRNIAHATLKPKPWQIDKILHKEQHRQLSFSSGDSVEAYKRRVDHWWAQVGPWAEHVFRDDRLCGAVFHQQRELHRHWKLGRKPVVWVNVHKGAGNAVSELAKVGELARKQVRKKCNYSDPPDAFFPAEDGLAHQCVNRLEKFLENGLTWGQFEREFTPGDYCQDDFIYGITLRDPVSAIESYANADNTAVESHDWMGYMSCIRQKNGGACPDRRYQEWDNYHLRVLGGCDAMQLPPGGVNSSHLAAAIDLLERFDLVLPIESISSKRAQDEIQRVLGWNQTSSRMQGEMHGRESAQSRVVFTEDQRAAWADINRFDVQLHAHFAQRYQ